MRVIVLTNQKHHWLLPGFASCFNRYWDSRTPQEVLVATYGPQDTDLPPNFVWHQIDDHNYGFQQWGDGMLRLMDQIAEKYFLLLLEDFYIYNFVPTDYVKWLWRKLRATADLLRIDLSTDRASKRHVPTGIPTVIESPPPNKYQMSLQAALWDKELMREVIEPDWSPWDCEIEGTKKLNLRTDIRVWGTTRAPIKYAPIYRARQNRVQLEKLPSHLRVGLVKAGLLKR